MRTVLLSLVFFAALPRPGFCQRTDSITVYFAFDRSNISPGSDSALHAYFQEHTVIKSALLSGYCDSIGSDQYNDSLALQRVMTVKRYLLRTLPVSVIKETRGFGKRRPLNDNSTAEARAMNRRVVVVVHRGEPTLPVVPAVPASVPASRPASVPASVPSGSIHQALQDSATAVGASIILKNVNFYGGRHFPLDSSYAALDDLLLAMRDNPHLLIRIEGYVCCVAESMDGPDIDTKRPNLSVARARFVYEYLLQHGVDSSRMSYIGLGGANKIYPAERDPMEQQSNRRVEIRVMGK